MGDSPTFTSYRRAWLPTAHNLDASSLDSRMEIITESFSPPWGSPSVQTTLHLAHTAGIKLSFLSSVSPLCVPLLFGSSSFWCLFSLVSRLSGVSSFCFVFSSRPFLSLHTLYEKQTLRLQQRRRRSPLTTLLTCRTSVCRGHSLRREHRRRGYR